MKVWNKNKQLKVAIKVIKIAFAFTESSLGEASLVSIKIRQVCNFSSLTCINVITQSFISFYFENSSYGLKNQS